MKSADRVGRSLVKSITYRVFIVISTFIVVFLLTGEVQETVEITIVTNVANSLLYFFHERLWNRVHWGKAA